jgi:tripartite-type tricarboxylate transporter receptor subunit TctC
MLRWSTGGLVILMAVALGAPAQSGYPNKPIRFVIGFAAGGPTDIMARIVGAKTGELLGQQVIIENKTGAGGLIATEMVARSEPDGYTLLCTATSAAVNETLSKTIRIELGRRPRPPTSWWCIPRSASTTSPALRRWPAPSLARFSTPPPAAARRRI